MKKILLTVCIILAITGCALPQVPTIPISAIFDVAAAKAQLVDGTNTIRGSGFMRQKGGGVVTCAGQPVYLVPATSYATERVRLLYGSTEKGVNSGSRNYRFNPDPPEYRSLTKTSRCDSQGSFVFERVADGDFYINTLVFWQVGSSAQGGQLMQRVTVTGGQSVSLVVAP
jgi:hypothetical protein